MLRTLLAIALCAILLTPAPLALARDVQWHGLAAVSLSPDGTTLVTGGQNRVLYLLDATTLEVKQRVWFKNRIGFLAFSRDGATLVVEDDDEALHFFDTATLRLKKVVARTGYASAAPHADQLVAVERSSKGRFVVVRSLSDARLLAKIPLPPDLRTRTVTLNADASKIIVLSRPFEGSETRVPPTTSPKGLEGLLLKTYRLQHDGRQSRLLTFDVATGALIADRTLWYSTTRARLAVVDDRVVVLNYDNTLADIAADGTITLFAAKNRNNYGHALATDHRRAVLGGLREGTLIDLTDQSMTTFKIGSLPGWPEYFEGFVMDPKGTVYGVTSAFRVARITADGNVDKVAPVY